MVHQQSTHVKVLHSGSITRRSFLAPRSAAGAPWR